ncbi:PorV/PorQ family protein [bacterium]|nr:PorV/PorQ family protein [bacterium]
MKKKIILLLIISSFGFLPKICFGSDIGTTGGQFLKIGIGARPVAMGESFVAVANDANSCYWNPAGLSEIKTIQTTTTYLQWLEDTGYTYSSYIQPLKDNYFHYGTIALSLAYLGMGAIPKTEIDINDNIVATGKSFDASDIAFIFSYGGKIKNFLVGYNIKYIKQTIEEEKASTFSLDLGMKYLFSDNLSFGLVTQNIGGKVKFVKEEDPLPLNIKSGIAYKTLHNSLFSFDIHFPVEINQPNYHLGIEQVLSNLFVLRSGYKLNSVSDSKELSGLSFGLGLKWKKYHLDYAWVPYGNLGQTHHISLFLKFN